MSDSSSSGFALRLLAKALLNILLVWIMAEYVDRYFFLTGGFPAYLVMGSLITLLNLFVRPILYLITLPLKLFATILASVLVNGLFVQLILEISQYMDQKILTLDIEGGFVGWLTVATILGFANWVIKVVLK